MFPIWLGANAFSIVLKIFRKQSMRLLQSVRKINIKLQKLIIS